MEERWEEVTDEEAQEQEHRRAEQQRLEQQQQAQQRERMPGDALFGSAVDVDLTAQPLADARFSLVSETYEELHVLMGILKISPLRKCVGVCRRIDSVDVVR